MCLAAAKRIGAVSGSCYTTADMEQGGANAMGLDDPQYDNKLTAIPLVSYHCQLSRAGRAASEASTALAMPDGGC
jgi:hypothetical protein